MAGDHRDSAVAAGEEVGGFLHGGFDRAAFLVEAVEFGCDRSRFIGVLRGQQADAEVRATYPAAGVDARAQCEAEVGAGRVAGQTRGLDQRGDADVLARAHDLEALRHERAVEAAKLRDVGDGTERDDIEQLDQLGLGAVLEEAAGAECADERGGGEEAHPDRGEMAVRGAFGLVEAVGVYQRERVRERGRAFVVVDDDHVDLRVAGGVERVERLRAAIDRDDQRGAFAGEADERFARWAITFEQAVGDVRARFDAEIAQDEDHQRGGGGAVDVVIAEDRDLFVRLHGVGEALGGAVHVAEDRRVGHKRADRRRAVRVERVAGAASGEEKLGDEVVAGKAVPAVGG